MCTQVFVPLMLLTLSEQLSDLQTISKRLQWKICFKAHALHRFPPIALFIDERCTDAPYMSVVRERHPEIS